MQDRIPATRAPGAWVVVVVAAVAVAAAAAVAVVGRKGLPLYDASLDIVPTNVYHNKRISSYLDAEEVIVLKEE